MSDIDGGTSRGHRWSDQVWLRVRRPRETVEATRWLFAAMSLASLLMVLTAPLIADHGPGLLVALAGAAVLTVSLGTGYLRRSAPLGLDLLDSVAVMAFAVACPEPAAAFAVVFPMLWFRSLYGSARRAMLRCSLYALALGATVPLWPYVPGHLGGTRIDPLISPFPTMFLTVVVSRQLVRSLRARERTARRDAVVAAVGSKMLDVTDAAEIRRIAWEAIVEICAATPRLRVLKVVRQEAVLRVEGATGGFADVPATLPGLVVPVPGGGEEAGSWTVGRRTELDAAVGTPCVWTCLPLPDLPDQDRVAWLLLGSPRRVPAEALVAIGSLASQVGLALRHSQAQRELTVQATLDGLTGLVNRSSFNAALSAALHDE